MIDIEDYRGSSINDLIYSNMCCCGGIFEWGKFDENEDHLVCNKCGLTIILKG